MPAPAIEAVGLVKHYGEKVALSGVDITVPVGSVTSVLGPNGAGKTTAVRLLTTLSTMTAGEATVAGFDVRTQPEEVRRRIGLTAQDATVDPLLTGFENLVMVGELHQLRRSEARTRADELLETFDLVEAGRRPSGGYSGGMRRRLDLAVTLVAHPEVLFLDEPTTGLDPRARNDLWEVLERLVDDGATILLTTQYLEEADRLADDILVVDHGTVIARGDSRSLKRQVGGDNIVATASDPADLARIAEVLRAIGEVEPTISEGDRTVVVPTADGVRGLARAAQGIADAEVELEDLGLRQATLDEVFLTLTGNPIEEDEEEER